MRWRFLLAAALATLTPSIHAEEVDPMQLAHSDFVRHRDAELWDGLKVERRNVADAGADWRIWRIVNVADTDGPLWVVPHDNENGAFAAGLAAVRRWGGVLVAVDSGEEDHRHAARYVRGHDGGRVDPNRSFTDAWPNYVAAMLADLDGGGRPIMALHTNAAGFDPALAGCGEPPPVGSAGSGGVSIRLCNATYTPFAAPAASWPWDDDDSVIISPYLAAAAPNSAWCGQPMLNAGVNITFERVGRSDGSLSNHAVQRGLRYLNFETRDRGADAAGIAEARDRLLAMIAVAMDRCVASPPPARLVAAAGMGREAR